jgi:hypothetical protein
LTSAEQKNNLKHISKEALIKQIETAQNTLNKLFSNMLTVLDETPLSWADQKAELAYNMLKKKEYFTSMDCVTIGVSERYKKQRVFDKLCERHAEVRIRQTKDPKTNRERKIAYIPKESKPMEFDLEEIENLPKTVQDLEGGDYVRIREAFKETDKTTLKMLAKKLNISEENAQKIISELIRDKKIWKSPEETFKWVGE